MAWENPKAPNPELQIVMSPRDTPIYRFVFCLVVKLFVTEERLLKLRFRGVQARREPAERLHALSVAHARTLDIC